MKYSVECTICGFEFEAEEWYDGNCPHCDTTYTWDSSCEYDEYGECAGHNAIIWIVFEGK